MKKTLLLTTALIGALSILGSAQAEIKVGGHVKLAYKSMEGFGAARSNSGFSQERQLDFKSEGTLNNGMKYAAGFSLEQDGGETGFDGGELRSLTRGRNIHIDTPKGAYGLVEDSHLAICHVITECLRSIK